MEPWVEVYSPILLIIRDDRRRVFGALVSDALRQCEHYYGTADACFLFKFADPDNLQSENKDKDSSEYTTSIDPWVFCISNYFYYLSL